MASVGDTLVPLLAVYVEFSSSVKESMMLFAYSPSDGMSMLRRSSSTSSASEVSFAGMSENLLIE